MTAFCRVHRVHYSAADGRCPLCEREDREEQTHETGGRYV